MYSNRKHLFKMIKIFYNITAFAVFCNEWWMMMVVVCVYMYTVNIYKLYVVYI